jgi:hypothetical protein
MKVGKLKQLISNIPDDIDFVLYNCANEWYGIEDIPPKAIKLIDNRLVINFALYWDTYLEDEFTKEVTNG